MDDDATLNMAWDGRRDMIADGHKHLIILKISGNHAERVRSNETIFGKSRSDGRVSIEFWVVDNEALFLVLVGILALDGLPLSILRPLDYT